MIIITMTTVIIITISRSSHTFAKSVLVAMRDGQEEELKRRKVRRTAVTNTVWPERVMERLLLPTTSRTQPGGAKVSVAYGVTRPKMFLNLPKEDIVQQLREEYREEVPPPPSLSTLLTLIPANFLQPREADRESNVCVKHANITHLVMALRPVIPSLPVSSKELSSLVMCSPWHPPMAAPTPWHPPMVRPYTTEDPLTWPTACALRLKSSTIIFIIA